MLLYMSLLMIKSAGGIDPRSNTHEAIHKVLSHSVAMCHNPASISACHALSQLCVCCLHLHCQLSDSHKQTDFEPTLCLPLMQIWHPGASCENSTLLPSCVCYGSSGTGLGCPSAGLCPTVQVRATWLFHTYSYWSLQPWIADVFLTTSCPTESWILGI